MSRLIIEGNHHLEGEVNISGSKNAALCLIAGAVALRRKITLNNIPLLTDIHEFISILKKLNVNCYFVDKHSLYIDSTDLKYTSLCINEVKKFRASYYLIGALLPHFHHLEIYYPGGCDFSKRPIDIHLKMFKDYGATYIENEYITFDFNTFKNYKIELKNISFGATVNAILMGLFSKEDIIIENVSKECEIDCFIDLINKAGGEIKRNNNAILISHKHNYHDVIFDNIPDRMEIGTFAFISASRGKIKLAPIIRSQIQYLEDVFNKLKINYYFSNDYLVVEQTESNKNLVLETGEYPLFPTDLQPILTAYLTTIKRIHVIKENIYEKRFSHVEELKKLGAVIFVEGNTLMVNGIFSLYGNTVYAYDLRCGAALLLASLNADGKTIIENGNIIDRGYENIIYKLKNIGAHIEVEP